MKIFLLTVMEYIKHSDLEHNLKNIKVSNWNDEDIKRITGTSPSRFKVYG